MKPLRRDPGGAKSREANWCANASDRVGCERIGKEAVASARLAGLLSGTFPIVKEPRRRGSVTPAGSPALAPGIHARLALLLHSRCLDAPTPGGWVPKIT